MVSTWNMHTSDVEGRNTHKKIPQSDCRSSWTGGKRKEESDVAGIGYERSEFDRPGVGVRQCASACPSDS